MTKTRANIDIDSPRIREFVTENAFVFRKSMDGMVEACQMPDATTEENIGLILRGAIAYATGICRTFDVSPEIFAELMHEFQGGKAITIPTAPKLNS